MAASCASTFLQTSLGTRIHVQALCDKGDARQMHYGFSHRSLPRLDSGKYSRNNCGTLSTSGRMKFSSPSDVKSSHATLAIASDKVTSESDSQGEVENGFHNNALFPDGFESLIMEVCDETDVAEIKLKAGNFEMHMRRNIEKRNGPSPSVAAPIISQATVVSDPIVSTPAPSPKHPKLPLSTGSSNPFTNKSSEVTSEEGLFIVTAPKVGIFKKNRVAKGKVGPVMCKEGKSIKEGQVVCYLEHLGSQLPIMSKVAGEIVKVIPDDGVPVGFNDPLVAILPSFHGIK
ncbi:hypothetical protein SUGI_0752580 [Cryptomeria japonica]|uniref:uncharacterized protein LOC131048341 n=1 Tax=Cryptomeria japonica TaxID=3369 RepID=UPI002414C4FF|nr:uncharacterized protein LOC131048341 [Cryptomeria japonica]GLJ37116.1 hypothetical protein SUGI_0752580 [Cryptomeria japonica]